MTSGIIRRHDARRFWRAALIVGIIVIALALKLVVSIGLADGSYRITSLQQQQKQIARQSQTVSEEISALESPQNLAEQAESLGMRPSTQVTFLSLSDGRVLGSADVKGAQVPAQESLVGNAVLDSTQTRSTDATSSSVPQSVAGEGQASDVSAADDATDDVTDDAQSVDGGDGLPEMTLR